MLSKKLKIKIHRTIILPVVLYGCETWSLTLREEHRLRVFENRVLRIFELKGAEVAEGFRKITRASLFVIFSKCYIGGSDREELVDATY